MAEDRQYPLTGNHVKFVTGDGTTTSADADSPAQSDIAYVRWGKENKTGDLEGMWLCWETDIPVGATINRASMTVVPSSTNAVGPGLGLIEVLAPGLWSSASAVATQARSRLRTTAYNAAPAVIAQGATTSTADSHLKLAPVTNLDSAAQVMTASSTSALAAIQIAAWRDPVYGSNVAADGIVWWEVYSVTGSAGAYREDVLLASSDNLFYNDLSAVADTAQQWSFSGANAITLTSGTNYIFRIRTDGIDGDQAISMQQKIEATAQNNNSIFYGDFDGFSMNHFPAYGSLTGIGYVGSAATGFALSNTVSGEAQNLGESADPTYTPSASDDLSTSIGSSIGLINESSSVTVGVASVPADVLVGDFIYINFSNDTWVTSGNFSTEDLHQEWWEVLATASSSITVEWDETFSGVTGNITPQAGVFYLARSAGGELSTSGMDASDLRVSIQRAVNEADFTGRVGLAFLTSDAYSVENTLRAYHSEERFLSNEDFHGPTLWVHYTAASPTGISLDAETSLSSVVESAVGLRSRINASATLSPVVSGSLRIN